MTDILRGRPRSRRPAHAWQSRCDCARLKSFAHVRVLRILEQLLGGRDFQQLAVAHHPHALARPQFPADSFGWSTPSPAVPITGTYVSAQTSARRCVKSTRDGGGDCSVYRARQLVLDAWMCLFSNPARCLHRDRSNRSLAMTLTLSIGPLIALIAGILILVVPRLLNYIVAMYLIVIGILGLFGATNFNFV
jgi:hypothetical protein